MFLFFILQLFFLIWRMCFLFVYYVSRFFLSIFSFLFCAVHWVSHHIPKREEKKNEKSKIQTPKSRSKNVETCLPNTCLPHKCVCLTSASARPTASSPKAQTFEPPLTIHFDVLFAQFFSCYQGRGALHGILVHDWSPPRIKTIFCFLQIHQHKLEITQKVCKVWLINVLFPKNLEQKKIDGKNFARVPPRGPFPLW